MKTLEIPKIRSTRAAGRLATGLLMSVLTLAAGPSLGADAGPLVEFQPGTPARAAEVNRNFEDLRSATNSKSSDGLDFSATDASIQIVDTANTPTVVSSVTVTAPEAGLIALDFSAYLTISHTQNEGTSYVVCSLKTNSGSPESASGRIVGSRRFVPILSAQSSGTWYPHIDSQGVFEAAAAGTYSFNVVCYRNASASGASAFYRSLKASFHSARL